MQSVAMSVPERAARGYFNLSAMVDSLQPAFAIALRIYVARVFFLSGLTKVKDWNITLALFRDEYHVPVLPSAVAAALGTGAELGLPVLLLLGCGTRFAAAALFAFNIIAVISYSGLSPAGLKDHVLWGTLLLVLFFYGPGKLSVDHVLGQKLGRSV